MSHRTSSDDPRQILQRHRETWEAKPVLRAIYRRWYDRILTQLPTLGGKVIEVGGGGGNLRAELPGVITTDVVHCNWLDLVCDAHRLPVSDASLDGLVMVDVRHHLADPLAFVAEVGRVLRPGGRLVVLDVYISPFSHIIMKLAHPEPTDMNADLFATPEIKDDRHPWCANQAIATLLFWRHLKRFQALYEDLHVIRREISDFFAYPLSGGFEFRCLFPRWSLPLVFAVERMCTPLARCLAFRSLVVLEKSSPGIGHRLHHIDRSS